MSAKFSTPRAALAAGVLALSAALLATALPPGTDAVAQGSGSGSMTGSGSGSHMGRKAGKGSHAMGMPKGDRSEASKAYAAANAKMHAGMNIVFTGDSDVDFVKGMIPHHEGAVDMARIVLKHGKDPEVKKVAEEIIKAQESEIAWMKGWLAKTGK
jgi:hypothetical protein